MQLRLLLLVANANNFTLLYTQLKRDDKSFILPFAVCRLPFAVNVMLNLCNTTLPIPLHREPRKVRVITISVFFSDALVIRTSRSIYKL